MSFALAGCGPERLGSDWQPIEPRVIAPDFTLPQLDGPSVNLAALRGRIVIMEFWATWCGPCRFSLPSLDVIAKRYRPLGVTVLLINEGEDEARVRAWTRHRFTTPILLDRGQEAGTLYGVRGIPHLLVIDQTGRVAYVHEGYGGGLERSLSLILDQLLGGSHG